MAAVSRVIIFMLMLLPLITSSATTPTKASDCGQGISWTVVGLQLMDIATPNPLSPSQIDRMRKLDFHISGPTLAQEHFCRVNTDYYQGETTYQFSNWTYRCWDLDKVRLGDTEPVDPALSFKFDSAAADSDTAHRAKFWLKQEVECEARSVEAEASIGITMHCGLPYYPYGCFPCFEHQCNGTEFVIYSD
ncbi:hypothetical protein F5Y06DRAFT_45731 [Hypoxylon sp. FL0890]|nr:hypothetical protein F5Y06DRAFT_45731 [Hypoxylon sp. FL0890]